MLLQIIFFAKSEDSNVRFCRNFRVGSKLLRSPTHRVELRSVWLYCLFVPSKSSPYDRLRAACGKQCTKVIPHPLQGLGYEATVATLDRAALTSAVSSDIFPPDNVVVSLVSHTVRHCPGKQGFGDWQRGTTPLPTLMLPLPSALTKQITPQQTQQSISCWAI